MTDRHPQGNEQTGREESTVRQIIHPSTSRADIGHWRRPLDCDGYKRDMNTRDGSTQQPRNRNATTHVGIHAAARAYEGGMATLALAAVDVGDDNESW